MLLHDLRDGVDIHRVADALKAAARLPAEVASHTGNACLRFRARLEQLAESRGVGNARALQDGLWIGGAGLYQMVQRLEPLKKLGVGAARIHLAPPPVATGFADDFALLGDEFGIGVMAAFKGVALQDPLAEAVNGENGGAVIIHQRQLDSPLQFFRLLRVVIGIHQIQDVADSIGFGGCGIVGGHVQPAAALQQCPAQLLAKFPRGGVGERHHQNLLDGPSALQNQAQKDIRCV